MDVYVLGFAVHPAAPAIRGKRLEEVVFDTASAALRVAELDRDQLRGVTIAGCDELDGRSISGMLLAAPAGAYLKDEIKCADSGLDALIIGAARVGAGNCEVGLVVSWSKTSKAPVEDVMRMRCEPFFTRPIGLNMAIADGLFAQAVSNRYSLSEADAVGATMAARRRAISNPRATLQGPALEDEIASSAYVAAPLREGFRAGITDGAAAFVLVSGAWLARHPSARPLARIAGAGWRMDGYDLGGERLSGLHAFRRALADGLRMSGWRGDSLDVVEADMPTAYHDLAFSRALAEEQSFPGLLSPSGGCFAQHPYFCMGLINAGEALLQLKGEAGPHQVHGARRAAAHDCHGFAQQAHSIVMFEGA